MTILHEHLALLGLDLQATEKDIKRAYAKRLKQIDQVSQSSEFSKLRAAYEDAINFCKSREQAPQAFWKKLDAPLNHEATQRQEDFAASQTVMEAVEETIVSLINRTKSQSIPTPEFCISALRIALASNTLQSLIEREAFEVALVQALATQRFTNASAPMLIGASTVFAWQQQNHHILQQSADFGRYIEQLLDELALLNGSNAWMTLGRTERYWDARALDLERASFRKKCPSLFQFSYPSAVQDAWLSERASAPWVWKILNNYLDFREKYAITGALLQLLSIPFLIAITIWVVSMIGGQQAKSQATLCNQMYASIAKNGWQDLSMHDVVRLQTCAITEAPQTCYDQNQLKSLLTEIQLLGASSSFMFGITGYDLRIRTASGLSYELNDGTDCAVALDLLATSNWIGMGDEHAAKKLVRQAAACENRKLSASHRNQITFLKHTNLWPSYGTTHRKSLISYAELKTATPNIDETPSHIERNTTWAQCQER